MTTYARITGVGSYLPERILSNAELETMMDTSDEWIRSRTGIQERHIAAPDQNTADLAQYACQAALCDANAAANSIDLIILATTTPDRVFPSTACLVQSALNIGVCTAFDVQAVCSGFVYALSIAEKFICSGANQRALVIGAETFSRILDWDDRSTCILFGDGAGAVVLEAASEPGIYSTHLYADGNYSDSLTTPGYVAEGRLQGGSGFAAMNGGEVFKAAVNNMAAATEAALQANQLSADAIDWLIPHQANTRILSAVAKKLHFPEDKVVETVSQHGNTSAASIPLALDCAVRDGRIQRGQQLMFSAMGGGFTWGSALLKY